ncbi:hypothetical protein AIOL_001808 [Candidatus Rhodobacter oscarellae]|uniref:Uncharacterized protein n=1 Tax=Candidatus Rhodobacter oscarellae TaxID=1675527 RepID=A0A0J9E1S3_9RHOB|nr:DUF6477 family protein [Candidatus Rhodobacter lobularis]KMW56851.1 hypothetical protein AIOL_001808 [Candidatus Rhodobacter lobularis]
MPELMELLQNMRRPGLLLQAAKLGMKDYNRERTLKRLALPTAEQNATNAVHALMSTEDTMEHARRAGDASYTPSRHVEVLVALLAEIRRLAAPQARA